MYLEARKYVGKIDWNAVPKRDFNDPTPIDFSLYQTEAYKALASMFPERMVKHSDAGSQAAINVGYWRKANQIHGWFVREVQGGEDNCKEYPVSKAQLEDLLNVVRIVLDGDKEDARKLLPVTSGPFFGNYDEDDGYNEWYYEQLKHTETMLEDILAEAVEHEYDFYYQSSW
jgi:hypothetical protein